MERGNLESDSLNELFWGLTVPSGATILRIHVKLSLVESSITRLYIRKRWGGDEVVKQALNSFWRKFGQASDVFYDDEYKFCFMSFPSHAEAKAAISSLNDKAKLKGIVKEFSKETGRDPKAQKVALEIICFLVLESVILSGKRASWARPRRDRDDHNDFSVDEREYYDDCPDGEDRYVWDSYCASHN